MFETSGGVNAEGEQVVKQIFRFAGRAWARLSCCIQDSVAQAILNRCPDSGDVDVSDVQNIRDIRVDVCVPPSEER